VSVLLAAAAPVGRVVRDAMAAVGGELSELQLTGSRGRHCGITALAVVLATVLALIIRVDAAWWAAISAFVSLQTTAPASVQRGILRIAGTTVGAAAALLLSPWLVGDPVSLSLVLLVASTVGVLGLLVDGHGYAWLLGAITVDMVLLAALNDPLSALSTACNRVAEVSIGTLAAMAVAVLLSPVADPVAEAPPATPGWGNLLGEQWPATQHALRAGISVMLVPLAWNWLDLPGLSQTAVTVAAVMAVPAPSNAAPDPQKITERAMHRLLGCLLGGLAGLACLAVSVQTLLPWLLMLTTGIWIFAHLQGSQRGIGYVGTQGAVAFISTLIQGPEPPASIQPGILRLVGITGGLLILLVVSLLAAPSRPVEVAG
jgi:uncharacterized membrane protein YccC